MTKIKKDQLTGIVLVILGLIVAFLVNQFKTPMTASYPGPKLLPLISVTGFIICGSGIFIASTLKKDEKEGAFLDASGWKKIGATIIALILYVLLLKYLGYFIATPVVLYALITMFAKGNKAEWNSLWEYYLANIVDTNNIGGIQYG